MMWVLWIVAIVLVFVHPLLGMLALLILTIWTVGAAVVRSNEIRAYEARIDHTAPHTARVESADNIPTDKKIKISEHHASYLAALHALNEAYVKAKAAREVWIAADDAYHSQEKIYLGAHADTPGLVAIEAAFEAARGEWESTSKAIERGAEKKRLKACA